MLFSRTGERSMQNPVYPVIHAYIRSHFGSSYSRPEIEVKHRPFSLTHLQKHHAIAKCARVCKLFPHGEDQLVLSDIMLLCKAAS